MTVCWRLVAERPDLACFVLRRDCSSGRVEELPAASIERFGCAYTLIDRDLEPGAVLVYRVEAQDENGRRVLFETEPVTAPAAALRLYPNYPNPFNPITTISFFVPQEAPVRLAIYDTAGRRVRTLIDGEVLVGSGDVVWDGRSDAGSPVSSGVYYYRLEAGKENKTRKLILLR